MLTDLGGLPPERGQGPDSWVGLRGTSPCSLPGEFPPFLCLLKEGVLCSPGPCLSPGSLQCPYLEKGARVVPPSCGCWEVSRVSQLNHT